MQEDCNCQQQNDSASQRKQQICIGKSCHYISYEAAHCHQKCVWHLGRYMRNVVASCTGGGQDGGIGDRRTVIAKYRACQSCGQGNDQQFWCCACADLNYDWNEDTKGSPCCSGGEGKECCHRKNNCRDDRYWEVACQYNRFDIFAGTQYIRTDRTECPCKH